MEKDPFESEELPCIAVVELLKPAGMSVAWEQKRQLAEHLGQEARYPVWDNSGDLRISFQIMHGTNEQETVFAQECTEEAVAACGLMDIISLGRIRVRCLDDSIIQDGLAKVIPFPPRI